MPTAEHNFSSCSMYSDSLRQGQQEFTEQLEQVLTLLNGKLSERDQYHYKYIRTQCRKALAILAEGIEELQNTVRKREDELRRTETKRAEEDIRRNAAGILRQVHLPNYGPAVAAWSDCGDIYDSVVKQINALDSRRQTRKAKRSSNSRRSIR